MIYVRKKQYKGETDEIPIDAIIALEGNNSTIDEVVNLFQKLIDTDIVWSLQGFYGRKAIELIECGLCSYIGGEKSHFRAKAD